VDELTNGRTNAADGQSENPTLSGGERIKIHMAALVNRRVLFHRTRSIESVTR